MAELAERGTRLLAATIDELILLGISLPMVFGAVPAMAAMLREADVGSLDTSSLSATLASLPTAGLLHTVLTGPGTMITGLALTVWCVITVWLVAANGQSIGKRLVGIKVVRKDGSRASFARIFLLRNLLNSLPNLLPYFGLVFFGLLYQLIDPLLIYQASRQCLHDKIADTIVVRCR